MLIAVKNHDGHASVVTFETATFNRGTEPVLGKGETKISIYSIHVS